MFITLTTGTHEDAKMRVNVNHIVSYVKFSRESYTQLVTSEMQANDYSAVKETPEEIDMLIKQAMET
ncbi:hypothetical protein [Thorsellia anophelis]|uniref:Uncharacterized protein n=1 Tax=Thorsellia anophelis DSM 18579 TaxID=1123402 RepID=A0A1I0FR89_9GAMM|nr:hypothetical protein [Thorsellia anophelis]SET60141.1 hypothetical protein SAMN02583745_02844 [Thorsellia anophelis DSM 18579]